MPPITALELALAAALLCAISGVPPLFSRMPLFPGRRIASLHYIHLSCRWNGQLNHYILYIVAALIILLALSDFL